jgi:hypothetical protein
MYKICIRYICVKLPFDPVQVSNKKKNQITVKIKFEVKV